MLHTLPLIEKYNKRCDKQRKIHLARGAQFFDCGLTSTKITPSVGTPSFFHQLPDFHIFSPMISSNSRQPFKVFSGTKETLLDSFTFVVSRTFQKHNQSGKTIDSSMDYKTPIYKTMMAINVP